ncbi:hypothetical protein CERSUDRAFT_81801 [Gelatoporia subvermispora B]|uniref:Cytochrome P450 n=1 Tax=Ceriporiopsis subvermispora (strain B) TaxID=914234 RepID=M2R3E1_CERS8|nr:hypothetical protein CERSUDRAFT_81801 [Gelatoporia subvermispora B]
MLTLTGWDWGLGNMTYGPLWRRHRRLFHQYFNQHAVTAYKQDLEEASHKLLQRLLLQPEKFVYHLRYMLGAEFLSAVYGIHDAEEIDQYLAIAEKAIQGAEEALIPGSFLVDFLPTLKYVPAWMPGALFKRKAAEWKRNAMAMRNVPWQNVSAALDSHKPCIGASMLERISHLIGSEHAGEEEVAKNVAGTTYAAGSDTTYATLHIFFLAMVLYPDVQKRAQDEIAAVVGDDRLPNFSDYDKLMYLKAIWMECIRWQPAVPLGLAHKTLADDEYNGFRIPGRAIVMHNTWAILQDPKVYSEPKTFNPERFLRDGAWNLEVMDPAVIAFGAGRRICPGRYFAELSVFINAARILHTFDIMPALDAEGKQIKVEPDMTSGFVIHPKPFQCSIKPRSKAAESLIRGGNSDN